MPPEKIIKPPKSRLINTTVGEFVEAVFEAAMEEYNDEIIARRITTQLLLRKLRHQRRLLMAKETQAPTEKKAYLRSELNRMRAAKKG
jgi:hypothetical protein